MRESVSELMQRFRLEPLEDNLFRIFGGDKIQALIKKGIDEGATLVAGGPGLPEGVNKGFYVRPTIFADVTNDMTIAREEIFGPVLTILGAKDEAEAVKIANDTPYGLAGYVTGDTVESARRVGRQIRAGNVNLQGVPNDRTAPFGGYKQSGFGRETHKMMLNHYRQTKNMLISLDKNKLGFF